ncbi:hypothetical protein NDU88_005320 [Pleurodeles waltl]|uniref:Uncharacterized protein n=1 Tax=Pleurodeles waltl TaxID=8319 RepID=A0AAV7PGJ7_PLEWA|nr:hypothetical protein NDU88_005320 [Pleurodeles waltl]
MVGTYACCIRDTLETLYLDAETKMAGMYARCVRNMLETSSVDVQCGFLDRIWFALPHEGYQWNVTVACNCIR